MVLARLLLVLAVMVPGAALAAGDRVEVTRGQELAHAWCASCHAVDRGQLRGPNLDAPSFGAVAKLPSNTELALRAFLSTPHGDMPDIKLTPDQIDEIIAYILSLKEP